uniref:Uncharacterized protein n=1 Tax=Tetranychus urticae TaxID=32264 RepID=A0A158P4M5_TETUR
MANTLTDNTNHFQTREMLLKLYWDKLSVIRRPLKMDKANGKLKFMFKSIPLVAFKTVLSLVISVFTFFAVFTDLPAKVTTKFINVKD